jgi:hypothetical protein
VTIGNGETRVVVFLTQRRPKISDSRNDSNDTAQRLAQAHHRCRP